MDRDDKLRVLYLLRILAERTDEDHSLTTPEICRILKEEYGIETFRTTVASDVEALQRAGFGIQTVRSKQNRYNYIDRDFDVPEVKILADAVLSSRFITKAKSAALADKILKLAGPYRAGEIKRNLVMDGRIKPENEKVFYIADAKNEAINLTRKISFQMAEYNLKKRRVHKNGGEKYIFSPYALVWDGDYYYAVGYSEKHGSIGSHRVDRIYRTPEILDEEAVAPPASFNLNRYVSTMFRMYDAARREVELLADNEIIDAVIDRFGRDAVITPRPDGRFALKTEVAAGPGFYGWVFGTCGRVTITGPEDVKKAYGRLVRKAAEQL